MVKFHFKHKKPVKIPVIKIGFRRLNDAIRAEKYLGRQNQIRPIQLSTEISESQREVLDKAEVDYYIIEST